MADLGWETSADPPVLACKPSQDSDRIELPGQSWPGFLQFPQRVPAFKSSPPNYIPMCNDSGAWLCLMMRQMYALEGRSVLPGCVNGDGISVRVLPNPASPDGSTGNAI